MKFSKNRYPSASEICTITEVKRLKTAALLFDRIYAGTKNEYSKNGGIYEEIPEEFTFGISEIDEQSIEASLPSIPKLARRINVKSFTQKDAEQFGTDFLLIVIAQMVDLYGEKGITVIPTYKSFDQFRISFPKGHFIAYQAALNNLPVVSEDRLSWKQTIEFRKDQEAVNRYRSLRLWLTDGLKAKSINQATDIIAKRIEDYQWAIKKHGLNTVTGVFSKIVSLSSISAVATGAGMTAMIGGPIWSAIVAGAITSAEVGVYLFERHIDKLSMIKESYDDVAILHEAKKLLEKSK